MSELLPCPFCGERPVWEGNAIECHNSDCWGPRVGQFEQAEDAVAAWNRRAPSGMPVGSQASKRIIWQTHHGISVDVTAEAFVVSRDHLHIELLVKDVPDYLPVYGTKAVK
jgi:hypothetical protein